jgi:hypothetical protein
MFNKTPKPLLDVVCTEEDEKLIRGLMKGQNLKLQTHQKVMDPKDFQTPGKHLVMVSEPMRYTIHAAQILQLAEFWKVPVIFFSSIDELEKEAKNFIKEP